MKALTLIQPWATLVVTGCKRIETRSWHTNYTGPLAIHASARMDDRWMRLLETDPHFHAAFAPWKLENWYDAYGEFPFGALIGQVYLRGCYRTDDPGVPQPDDQERAFGDFSPGRWMWLLDDPRQFSPVVPCRGYQRLWETPDNIIIMRRSTDGPTSTTH